MRRDAVVRRARAHEVGAGEARERMVGQEVGVRDPRVAHRFGEQSTHRDLSTTLIAESADRISTIAERVSLEVEHPLRRSVTLDAQPDAVRAPPAIRPLTTRVRAVDAATSRPMDVRHGGSAHRAIVLADHEGIGVGHGRFGRHVTTMTAGCDNHRPPRRSGGVAVRSFRIVSTADRHDLANRLTGVRPAPAESSLGVDLSTTGPGETF
jgi:hypothetical protein